MVRYYTAAAGLSAGWYLVLLVPSLSRGWLLENEDPIYHLVLLVTSGLIIARAARRYILSADNWGGRFVRASVLPLSGAFLYLLLVVAGMWIRQMVAGGLTNLHDSLSLVLNGLIFTVLYFWIVIPYGLFSQYVLEGAARRDG